MSSLAEAVVETTGDLFGAPPALETPEPEPAPEPEAEPGLAPAADLTDLFGEDSFELEETEIVTFDELDEDQLRAELVKAQRKAEHEKGLRVQTGLKAWRAEAEQKFPYSQPGQISAESRREFLRQAQARDNAFRAQAQPLIDQFKAREAALEARLRTEIKAEYEQGWGTPTLGGGPSAPPAAPMAAKLEEARKKRSLLAATRALMDGGGI